MTLKQIREFVKNSHFFPKSIEKLLHIVDSANKKNYLTEGEKKKMIEIINLEIEVAHIKTDLFEKVSLSLEELIQNSSRIILNQKV